MNAVIDCDIDLICHNKNMDNQIDKKFMCENCEHFTIIPEHTKEEVAKLTKQEHVLRLLKGRGLPSIRTDGWEHRRKKILLRYLNELLSKNYSKNDFCYIDQYHNQVANRRLLLLHADRLLDLLPSCIGCSDNKIVIGECTPEVEEALPKVFPRLIIEIVDDENGNS